MTAARTTILTRLVEFTRSEEGRPALLGFLGAVLITVGGLGAGSTGSTIRCWNRRRCPGCGSVTGW